MIYIFTAKPQIISQFGATDSYYTASEIQPIKCEATGSPKPKVTWYQIISSINNHNTNNTNRTQMTLSSLGVAVLSSAVLRRNDGTTVYACYAENSQGVDTKLMKVSILPIGLLPEIVEIDIRLCLMFCIILLSIHIVFSSKIIFFSSAESI